MVNTSPVERQFRVAVNLKPNIFMMTHERLVKTGASDDLIDRRWYH